MKTTSFSTITNGVIITDGIGRILGPRYIRLICQIPRGPYAHRKVLRVESNPKWIDGREFSGNRRASDATSRKDTSAASGIAKTNHEGPDELAHDEMATEADDELALDGLGDQEAIRSDAMTAMRPTPTVELDSVVGLNPFSDTEEEPASSWAGGDFFTVAAPDKEELVDDAYQPVKDEFDNGLATS